MYIVPADSSSCAKALEHALFLSENGETTDLYAQVAVIATYLRDIEVGYRALNARLMYALDCGTAEEVTVLKNQVIAYQDVMAHARAHTLAAATLQIKVAKMAIREATLRSSIPHLRALLRATILSRKLQQLACCYPHRQPS